MTLIRSLGSCFFHCCSLLMGTLITTVGGYEKGLLDDSKLNTRYRDKGSDKKPGSARGKNLPIKFYSLWSYKQLIRLGSLMTWIILLTHGKCGVTGVKKDRMQLCTISYKKWLCRAPGVLEREDMVTLGANIRLRWCHVDNGYYCIATWNSGIQK